MYKQETAVSKSWKMNECGMKYIGQTNRTLKILLTILFLLYISNKFRT